MGTMLEFIKQRLRDEAGAVTVDWVVLTASVVSLGMIVGGVIWNNSDTLVVEIASFVSSQTVQSSF